MLQSGGVVDAVTGHGDDGALRLQQLYQPQLMLRADARIYVHFTRTRAQRDIVHPVEVVTGNGLGAVFQIKLCRNGARRAGMVTRNHLHADTRRPALGHRLYRLRARRIDEAEQAEQHQALFHIVKIQLLLVNVRRLTGHRQHALTLVCQLLHPLPPAFGIHRKLLSRCA